MPLTGSFNNPLGMCTDCSGLGTRAEMDPDLIVPDKTRSIREGAVDDQPMPRMGEPEEIGEAVVWLASDAASTRR